MSKIPDKYVPELSERVALGATPGEAAQWLKDTHGISVAESTVSKRLKRIAEERAPLVRAVTEALLREKIGKDLDALDGVIARALEDEQKARAVVYNIRPAGPPPTGQVAEGEEAKWPPVVAGSEQYSRLMQVVRGSRGDLLAAIGLRLKLAGVGIKDGGEKDPKEAEEKLMNKLDQIFASLPAPAPQDPPQLKLVEGTRVG